MSDSLLQLIDRYRNKDRRALSRLLTLAARGEHLSEILAAASVPQSKRIPVVTLTGSAGVGKSTLTGKLIELLRRKDKRVAVLACDPQSPLSGGALLGDRFRMPTTPDEGVFIRSLSSAGGRGAIAEHLPVLLKLLAGFGFDVILLETVGAGQGDTVVRDIADVVVFLVQPETGDDLQWEKAGLLEVCDIVVIHKSDLPGAEHAEAQLRSMLELSSGPIPVILRVSSKTGSGMEELWQAIERAADSEHVRRDAGRELLRQVQEFLSARFVQLEEDAALQQLVADWKAGEVDLNDAARRLVDLLLTAGANPRSSP
ncbi:MAG: GTPase [Gemmatales bacterium]|nr:MAG: GTPase [Gemmatales bacterium]